MNFELGPIEKYANNSSFTKSIQYLPRSKSPEPNSCLRSVQGSRYGLLPQRRRMPFRFRWSKTVNRKTPSKRFGLRTVLSKNQFGAHDRRETVWRRRSEVSLWSFKDFIGSCNAGPKPPLRGNGSELNSPSNMFFGLPLRFKSVLRNSGRIYLAAARMETSPHSSSTTERARLPH